ncbi:MAG: CYTH domain-containing protein [Flavobacteriaceae bacterium]|nr:CYTH domain-containing protein [Flavobacteriaceae bacterium]
MLLEIERKFLVKNNSYKEESFKCLSINQGFLNSNRNRVVRVRVVDDKGFITIKGKSNKKGTTRFEWEKEISLKEAKKLLKLCEKGVIKKTRYLVRVENHIYEVDVFKRKNKGLVVAEIELNSESELFLKPSWLGEEVTGEIKYYNSELSKNPFKNWA